jgi:hypothetical protein
MLLLVQRPRASVVCRHGGELCELRAAGARPAPAVAAASLVETAATVSGTAVTYFLSRIAGIGVGPRGA